VEEEAGENELAEGLVVSLETIGLRRIPVKSGR